MKLKILLMFCVILVAGCTNKKSTTMTDDEKSAINQEVSNFIKIFYDSFSTFTFDSLIARMAPDFIYIGKDGTILSYKDQINALPTMRIYFKEITFTENDREIFILSPDVAVCRTTYSTKMIYKNDKIEDYPKTVATNLFQKINNKWMCIWIHESGPAAIQALLGN